MTHRSSSAVGQVSIMASKAVVRPVAKAPPVGFDAIISKASRSKQGPLRHGHFCRISGFAVKDTNLCITWLLPLSPSAARFATNGFAFPSPGLYRARLRPVTVVAVAAAVGSKRFLSASLPVDHGSSFATARAATLCRTVCWTSGAIRERGRPPHHSSGDGQPSEKRTRSPERAPKDNGPAGARAFLRAGSLCADPSQRRLA
jgi:hypothetical protein